MTDRNEVPPIEAWFAGRSAARGLPAPVRDASGALRVETGVPTERRRYMFAHAGEPLRALGATIIEPFVAVRVATSTDVLRAMVPPSWTFGPEATVMTVADLPASPSAIPEGYRLELDEDGERSSIAIAAPDGTLAASGHAAETAGVFVFDRIVVDTNHRRRGLGRALVTALGTRRRSPDSIPMLVATAEGRALYGTLGWRPLGPYSSATSPET